MRYLFSFTLLVMLFCSGFTWEKAKEERCNEANEPVLHQQVKSTDPVPADLERKVAEPCPGGTLNATGDIDVTKPELKLAGAPLSSETKSLINQGDAYFVLRDFPAAIQCYKDALETKTTPDILQKLAVAYLAVGNDDDALASYLKSLSISPDDAGVHYSVAVILERKGDIDKAVAEYERCIVFDKNNEDARRRLAEIYTLKGDLQKAISEYQAIIEHAPNSSSIQIKLARVYQKAERYSDAAKSFESALLLDPKNLEVRREFIKFKIKTKDLQGAEKLCREILASNRDDKQERKRLIGILGQLKKYHELEVFLTDESTRYPTDSTIFYRLGIVKDYLNEFRGAIQAFLKSIDIKPTARSYNALARAYLSISEPKKARDALVEANTLDPNKKDVKELIEIIDESLEHSNAGSSVKGSGKKNRP